MRTNNIKQVRERLGLSQAAFAEAIGVSQGNISHYECQRQDVSPDVARRVIAAAQERGVQVSFDDIYVAEGGSGAAANNETTGSEAAA
jgi:transcriptional regulator with XRE-family HTH domain